jgi:hypothetical protein
VRLSSGLEVDDCALYVMASHIDPAYKHGYVNLTRQMEAGRLRGMAPDTGRSLCGRKQCLRVQWRDDGTTLTRADLLASWAWHTATVDDGAALADRWITAAMNVCPCRNGLLHIHGQGGTLVRKLCVAAAFMHAAKHAPQKRAAWYGLAGAVAQRQCSTLRIDTGSGDGDAAAPNGAGAISDRVHGVGAAGAGAGTVESKGDDTTGAAAAAAEQTQLQPWGDCSTWRVYLHGGSAEGGSDGGSVSGGEWVSVADIVARGDACGT